MSFIKKEGDYILDFSDMVSPMEEIRRKVLEAIADDHEGKVRQTLIELGWSPPREEKPSLLEPSDGDSDLLNPQ